MVETPRSAATRLIDTAWRPSAAATRAAAATIRSRLRAGRGPLLGRWRTPQAASMLAGRPVPLRSLIRLVSIGLTPILILCIPYTDKCMLYTVECVSYAEGVEMSGQLMIEASGLEKSYGAVRVLDGVDLEVERGRVIALLGPNGAGKTTTVRILATLARTDAGTARVAGFDVVTERRQVRRRISLTGQYAALDELQTGEENLRMMGRLSGLAEAGRRAVGTFSGGMRRRLDLAASLVGQPSVIFLDEPTTGLDPRSRQAVWQVVAGLAPSGVTIFLTTQY